MTRQSTISTPSTEKDHYDTNRRTNPRPAPARTGQDHTLCQTTNDRCKWLIFSVGRRDAASKPTGMSLRRLDINHLQRSQSKYAFSLPARKMRNGARSVPRARHLSGISLPLVGQGLNPVEKSPIKRGMKNSRGLTLIELMVTLAVFAIVTALAFPGFRLYQQNSLRVTQINDMVASFNMARTEAVKRNRNVAICASADQATCSGANDWTTGWIVFVDDNQDGNIDANEALLQSHAGLDGASLIFQDVDNGAVAVSFNNRGIPFAFDDTGNTFSSASFMRCDDRRNTDSVPDRHARAVLLTSSGRIRLSSNTDGDANDIHEGLTGTLNCP
ncbi:MAG TPA: prepilin-type N-terminal cleavage/methylation domain-containing protein [Gammaproteobacteria bacterium]|nr:prepilin-type N-terminal cleavage/methylation domain-containing protein [Gammaproteobacteria bacterium]